MSRAPTSSVRPRPLGSLAASPFEDVSRIAVLRGGGLGDVLFALPALAALRAAYPDASIALLGMPLHGALFAAHPEIVDEVVELPPAEGVRPGEEDPERTDAFVARMRERAFDLAVQLHGGGRHSNPFLARLGARHTVGARTPDAPPLERTVDYVYYQHEVLRALEVVGLAGAAPVVLEPELAPTAEERAAGRAILGDARVLALHPGATDPRRRWPAESFARVARRAIDDGLEVVVVGAGEDRESADRIVALASTPLARSLAGRLSLPELVGVLSAATALVGNDSGPRHLAQAVGCATVGVYWAGNLINAGPLSRGRHRIQLGWTTHCPVCGRDVTQVGWTAPRCEHDESLVADVSPDAVYAELAALTATTAPARA